jgi:peptide-methionine (R)-S-oxide reductase
MSDTQTQTKSAAGYSIAPLAPAERDRLAAQLSADEREVLLNHGTERPFCGTLLNNKQAGVYACRLCGLPLFRSEEKFESGTGWPSFTRGYDPEHIREIVDRKYGMVRTEIRCAAATAISATSSRRARADVPALLPQFGCDGVLRDRGRHPQTLIKWSSGAGPRLFGRGTCRAVIGCRADSRRGR